MQALIVQQSSLIYEHRAAVVNGATRLQLPDMYESRKYISAGGLVSYGPSVKELYRQAAASVDKVLRGAAPRDLAVEQPTKARAGHQSQHGQRLGLTISQSLLLRADEVVQ